MQLYDRHCESRLVLGTARYATPDVLSQSVRRGGVDVVTVSLRREGVNGHGFWPLVRALGVAVLPNTAGCRTAKEAITTARMARELFATPWLKLEVTGDEATLAPDPFATLEAATVLMAEGFQLFPYVTCDLALAERLVMLGCRVLMPWASPIGSGRGLADVEALRALRERHPTLTLIVDAGIGRPSHAAQAMELGYDGVLLDTAVALADDPPAMAEAFALAVRAGRLARDAGLLSPRAPEPSTPTHGLAFTP